MRPTRRRIISLLRGGDRTVAELSSMLGLTDNAVRSHLEALQKDQLVSRSGTRPGTRKPHVAYTLTDAAKALFFEGCHPLLAKLLAVISERLSRPELEAALKDCGRQMAWASLSEVGKKPSKFGDRLDFVLSTLTALGGQPTLERDAEKVAIRGAVCPWGVVAAEHPEVCFAAEAFVSELLGKPVKEHCSRDGIAPRCLFQVMNRP